MKGLINGNYQEKWFDVVRIELVTFMYVGIWIDKAIGGTVC